ncbi:lysophospholipase [Epithele typhae]|uniref:lysophospholipase n=1 Tax=Epithele typhae TaxID=378194 RepID=UPI002007C232|nr:lysophospholipase [Epithele typhae]KAH9935961.1 lysophospholipase [Epithele typhae]
MSSEPYTESWRDGPLATKFYTRLYLPPAGVAPVAVLTFVHGYIEHVGRYTAAHAAWAAAGVAVFAYDMRGFGRTALGDARSPASQYGKTGGVRERTMESTGRPLVGVARRHQPYIVRKLAVLLGKLAPNAVIKTPVQDKDLSHDENVGPDSLKDPYIKGYGRLEGLIDMIHRGEVLIWEGYKLWPSDDLPVLILHGTADQVNAFPPTKKFFEMLQAPNKEFIVYENMMHDLMTEPEIKEKYFQDCLSWVQKHLSPPAAPAGPASDSTAPAV